MARTKKNTPIKLVSVEQKAFRMDSSVLSPNDHDVLFGFNYSFSPNVKKDSVAVFFEIIMYTNDMQELLTLDTIHTFKVGNLSDFIEREDMGQARLTGIVKPLLDAVIGTTRGLLIAKTSGSPLSRFILPLIDVTRIARQSN